MAEQLVLAKQQAEAVSKLCQLELYADDGLSEAVGELQLAADELRLDRRL